MRRREFVQAIGLAAAWPITAAAQSRSSALKTVGVLWHAANAEEEREYLAVLTSAFSQLGYVEGKNVKFLHKYPAEQAERYVALGRELVDSNPDVIIAISQDGAVALKKMTNTIPIVFAIAPDPIGSGLITSLSHPGGNLTGLSLLANDVSGKRLSLLREAVPGLSRVALLINPQEVIAPRAIKASSAAAEAQGIALTVVETPRPDTVESAFERIKAERFDGAIVSGSTLFNERAKVGRLALDYRIPAITIVSEMVPYGVLMSYGPDFPDYFRKTAGYVVRILSGVHPADLPVEQPTRLKLAINLKAAKTMGLSLPSSLLVGADETIE